jgi:hypothetical protein
MRCRWWYGLVCLVCLVLVECGGSQDGGQRSGGTGRTSQLQLSLTTTEPAPATSRSAGATLRQQRQIDPHDPLFITRVEISIQAEDIVPSITLSLALTPDTQDTVTTEIQVPIGAQRRLRVSALNAANTELFRGETTFDLSRNIEPVTLTLVRILVPVAASPALLTLRTFTFADAAAFGLPGQTLMLRVGMFSGQTGPFMLRMGQAQAQGTVTIGSCTFVVLQSSFPAGQGPQMGSRLLIDPCQVDGVDGRLIATNGAINAVSVSAAPTIVPNDAPQAGDDHASTTLNMAVTLTVLANDRNPAGGPLQVAAECHGRPH